MSPFDVTIGGVADAELGPLLSRMAAAGLPNPAVSPVTARQSQSWPREPIDTPGQELAASWQLVRERSGESYSWPQYRETYEPYRIYLGTVENREPVILGLGETIRHNKWGRDRKYVVVFLSSGAPQQPLVEFLAADDYEQSRELVAIIRGLDGGRRMFGPADELPEAYELYFRTQVYGERVEYRGIWNKLVVVAREDDHKTMLNHALLQARRRYGI
jgi:hypothetical protein